MNYLNKCFLLFIVILCVSCGVSEEEKVREAYSIYLQAVEAGDIETYKSIRATEVVSFQEKHLGEIKQENLKIKGVPEVTLDDGEIQFDENQSRARYLSNVKADEKTMNWAKDNNFPQKEYVLVEVVMFEKENGKWKVGWSGRISDQKYKENNSLRTIDDFQLDEREKGDAFIFLRLLGHRTLLASYAKSLDVFVASP